VSKRVLPARRFQVEPLAAVLSFPRERRPCGCHRRDEELAELDAVIAGARRFADLPPRV
jgi:hypothetical protein